MKLAPVVRIGLLLIVVSTFAAVQPATAARANPGGSWRSIDELARAAGSIIDGYWAQAFRANGLRYYSPSWFGGYDRPIRSACGPTLYGNAAYCSGDHTVAYDRAFLAAQWRRHGDFAAVTILAHEWGHAVQAHFSLQGNNYAELQADCLAGSFALYAAQTGLLEEGDLDEGAASLFEAGDPRLPWFTPRTHGRPEERVDTFNLGLQNGYGVCFQVYQ